MKINEITGTWRIDANGFAATSQLWRAGSGLAGQLRFDNLANSEPLATPTFANDQLDFTRTTPSQRYSARVCGDELHGSFVQAGVSYAWSGRRLPPPLLGLASQRPRVRHNMAASPTTSRRSARSTWCVST